jgi:signal transduction histidine kinase
MHPSFLLIAGLLAAGTFIQGGLQFHWATEMRRMELERLRLHVRSAAAAFVRDAAPAGPECSSRNLFQTLSTKYFEAQPLEIDLEIRDADTETLCFRSGRIHADDPDVSASFVAVLSTPPPELGNTMVIRPLNAPQLELRLWTREGTLESVADRQRTRNLALAFSALALLVASGVFSVRTGRAAQVTGRRHMEFVASITHELKTPVSVIRSAAQNLSDGVASDPMQVREYGALIEAGGQRLAHTLDRVLMVAATLPQARARYELVEVNALLQEVARGLDDVTVCLAPVPGPQVWGDAHALRTAVEDLLVNAKKHATRDRRITLRVDRDAEQRVQISVADYGPGIPERELDQIFEPFQRGSRAVRDRVEGSGLGLYLVKCVVKSHHGEVDVQSSPERGSVFTIHLPEATI